ncbi:LPXTG cell wall anchor domain-containing protein [Enterococcus faecalis]|uniref:LPXTG cell wall anchor domain-containing protein n=1 Tax=Enterococcus faecalis TaxID=1351 RepID=UPI0022DECD11|nr:LPXTG cell wall anchor domain-containing protein [Enterococcus faecalis]
MKKKPSFFINVEASDGGSSSVGIEFYQNPRTPAPKDAPPKTDAPAADPKEPAGPPQGDQRSGGSTQTTTKSQANLSILGLVLIGLVGMVQRKKGRHEAN